MTAGIYQNENSDAAHPACRSRQRCVPIKGYATRDHIWLDLKKGIGKSLFETNVYDDVTGFGAQHSVDSVENKPASLLVVSLGKALNGTPPPLCGRQVAPPVLHRIIIVKLLTQHVRRLLGTHQWQSALLVVGLPVTQDWFEMGCHLPLA